MRHSLMRAAIGVLLVAATAHASPDPCTAKALHLTKVTEVAPVVVGANCHIRSTDGTIDKTTLHATFPSVPTRGEPGYAEPELTLRITSAKELAAAVSCDGKLPTIDFAKHRAWVIVREVGPGEAPELVRAFDNGTTLVFAERIRGVCHGGARRVSEPELVTTIVVAPVDRAIDRRQCYVAPEHPCPKNPK